MSERPRISVLRFRQLSTGRFYVPRDEVDERRSVRERREPAACALRADGAPARVPGLRPVARGPEVVEPANELLPVAGDAEDVGEPARRGEVLTRARASARRPRGRPAPGPRAAATLVVHAGDPRRSPDRRGRATSWPARPLSATAYFRRDRIRFYYDVVCPYSYMESHVVEAAEDAGPARGRVAALRAAPGAEAALEVRGDHLRTDWTRTSIAARSRSGVEIHLPRYQPRSTLTLGACLWAGDEGRLRDFKHALYEAFFCEGLDIATDAEIGARGRSAPGSTRSAPSAAAYDHARGERLREIRARGGGGRRRRRADAPHRGRPHATGAWAASSGCLRTSRSCPAR